MDQEIATEGPTASANLSIPEVLNEEQLRRILVVGCLNSQHRSELRIDSIIADSDDRLVAPLHVHSDGNFLLIQAHEPRGRLYGVRFSDIARVGRHYRGLRAVAGERTGHVIVKRPRGGEIESA